MVLLLTALFLCVLSSFSRALAQENKLAFHVRINARSENDLKEADIIGKINKAKGADFVKVFKANVSNFLLIF